MAVKVPALLHKMSVSAQKAWYKKHGMDMPSADDKGRSAAAAKKVKVEPRKELKAEPTSVRAMNIARQSGYYAKGGRQPIGAGGSGGSNVMAGAGQSTAKDIRAGIKAGFNPKVSLDPYESERAKKTGPRSLNVKMKKESVDEAVAKVKQINKQKLKNYVRGLGTKAVIAGKVPFDQVNSPLRAGRKALKQEEAELQETNGEYNRFGQPRPGSVDIDPKAGDTQPKHKMIPAKFKKMKKESIEIVDEATKQEAETVLGGTVKEKPKMPPGKQPAGYRYVRSLARKAMKAGLKKEEVLVDEEKKPDASMAMTHQLKMKAISDKDKRTLGKVAALMAAQKKTVKEESEMKYIEEKLTAADPASKWISDFVKSDNPKFAGKSKKERINQALGAYYAAKRGTNEEIEEVEEANTYPLLKPGQKLQAMKLKEEDKEMDDEEESEEDEMEDEDEKEDKEEKKSMEERYMGFSKLKASIAAKGGARDPAAVAAAIGRKKYGKEKFQAAAAAGKKMAEGLDPVGREDKDVDNDGDSDKTDLYLSKRRKAISSAIRKKVSDKMGK